METMEDEPLTLLLLYTVEDVVVLVEVAMTGGGILGMRIS